MGKIAWRNNTRCIGHRYWEGLVARDPRRPVLDCSSHVRFSLPRLS
ncbi:MAG: nitric oxide synthase oxygenase [Myxococcota bacterium]